MVTDAQLDETCADAQQFIREHREELAKRARECNLGFGAYLRWVMLVGLTANPAARGEEIIYVGGLVLNTNEYACTYHGSPVELTPKDFALLCEFATRPGRLITAAYLEEKLWGDTHSDAPRALLQHLRRLRAKLGWDARTGPLAVERGVGYRLLPERV